MVAAGAGIFFLVLGILAFRVWKKRTYSVDEMARNGSEPFGHSAFGEFLSWYAKTRYKLSRFFLPPIGASLMAMGILLLLLAAFDFLAT